jgi:hypothetical protein
MLGENDATKRDHLIFMSGNGELAIRDRTCKYIPGLAVADGWYAGKKQEAGAPKKAALFDLSKDPGEKQNLIQEKRAEARRLADLLVKDQAAAVTRPE